MKQVHGEPVAADYSGRSAEHPSGAAPADEAEGLGNRLPREKHVRNRELGGKGRRSIGQVRLRLRLDVDQRWPEIGEQPADGRGVPAQAGGVGGVAADGNRGQADGAVSAGAAARSRQDHLGALAGNGPEAFPAAGVIALIGKNENPHD